MNNTKISWTDMTWNPAHGCSKVSEGCRFCYAESLSVRYGHTKLPWTAPNVSFNVTLKRHKLREPYGLKVPSRVFVNSMSDLFHESIPDSYIAEVFAVMNDLPQHVFQVLTKRPERAAEWVGPWGDNIWMGASVEDARVLSRVNALRRSGAMVKFLSCEPLIGPLTGLDLTGIDWVIVGGESGFHLKDGPLNPRWMRHEWARGIRDACLDIGSAFFFKQSSGFKTEMGPSLEHEDGSFWEWHQFPASLIAPVQVVGPKTLIARG